MSNIMDELEQTVKEALKERNNIWAAAKMAVAAYYGQDLESAEGKQLLRTAMANLARATTPLPTPKVSLLTLLMTEEGEKIDVKMICLSDTNARDVMLKTLALQDVNAARKE